MNSVPVGISQAAINVLAGDVFLHELQWDIQRNTDPLEMEEVATGEVHLITQETITNYSKLITDPVTTEVWLEALATKLGEVTQG